MAAIIDIHEYIVDNYVPASLSEETFQVEFVDCKLEEVQTGRHHHGQQKCTHKSFPFQRCGLTVFPITEAKVLVAGHGAKKVLELTLDSSDYNNGSALEYEPGDTIGILPRNADSDVQRLLQTLRIEDRSEDFCSVKINENCSKKSIKVPIYIPDVTTPREILQDCLNLHGVPKKQFLRKLAEYCSNDEEKNFLKCISSKQGSGFYNEIFLEKGLTILDVLKSCPSCAPTLSGLIEYLPRLLPRPYSIANSGLASNDRIKIVFSILPHKPGVTTKMLDSLAEEVISGQWSSPNERPSVFGYLREPNKFRYGVTEAEKNDQILIAVGTGIAPFLGFLEHKCHLLRASPLSALGETWLVVGAPTKRSIPHRDRVLGYCKTNILQKYYESVSREPLPMANYVQDHISQNSNEFAEFLLRPSTCLYVCADGARISRSIEKAICECLTSSLGIEEAEAIQMVKEFRANGKYREDLWS